MTQQTFSSILEEQRLLILAILVIQISTQSREYHLTSARIVVRPPEPSVISLGSFSPLGYAIPVPMRPTDTIDQSLCSG